MSAPDPYEEQVAELYLLEPDDFVTQRTRLAQTVKDQGDEVGAARIRRLTKPTIAAYWVNQIAHRWPGELGELLDVGHELRAATSRRDRHRLLDLDRQRRVRTDALLSLLWHFGEDEALAGRRRPSAEALTRVHETLTAAVMDDEVADHVRTSRMTRTAVYEGFGPLTLLLDDGEDDATSSPTALVTQLPVRPVLVQPDPQYLIQRATADLVDAEHRVSAATETIESLTSMIAGLEHEIATLANDRDAARERLETWQRSLREAERAAGAAQRRLDVLTDEL